MFKCLYLNYVCATKNAIEAITTGPMEDRRTKIEPEAFGFLVEKAGAIPSIRLNSTDDERIAAFKKADEYLVLGQSGIIQGKAKADNPNYGENAYGAVVTPTDTLTGVWARAYVDFGNGLVVYSEPEYYASENEYYRDSLKVDYEYLNIHKFTGSETSDAGNKLEVSFRPYTGNGEFKAAGVVIDSAGTFNSIEEAEAGLVNDPTKFICGSWAKDKLREGEYNGNFTKLILCP